jgi:DNA-binding winged helix-turn-helix (wHTH) protein
MLDNRRHWHNRLWLGDRLAVVVSVAMTLLKEIANDSLAENAKLKAKIERLRAALKPFADEGSRIEAGPPGVTVHPRGFRVDELCAASSAFEREDAADALLSEIEKRGLVLVPKVPATAEDVMHEAMSRALLEFGLNKDPAAFVILTQQLTVRLLAKMVTPEMLDRDNGRQFIRGVLKQIEIMLVREINARLAIDAVRKNFKG